MKPFTKQLELCLSPADEHALSLALIDLRPRVAFVDGVVFPTSTPLLGATIDACHNGGQVCLWDRSDSPTLPVYPRKDGKFGGPSTGPVIQYLKPRTLGDRLESGRIAASAGGDDEATDAARLSFINDVWMLVKRATIPVQCVSAETGRVINTRVPAFRAGLQAARWVEEKRGRFFTDASHNCYLPLAEKVTKPKAKGARRTRA